MRRTATRVIGCSLALCFWTISAAAQQSGWKPAQPVEIISSTGVGGAQDRLARAIQGALQTEKLIPTPAVVVNKPGGNGGLSVAYLNQHPGDGHYLLASSALMLTNHIMGRGTELGKKFPDQPLDAKEAADMAKRDLDSGAHMVVLEKSDVALVIKNGTRTLHDLMRAVGKEKLIVECGPGADRFEIAKWLIAEFGMEVNLENIDAEDAHGIEAMRYGLNRAVDYRYFHEWHGKVLPAVPE